uniref:Uncharacterized protein n=1 Tax=Wuchereria bancrofti TaxID=6293 RepID=A0AAF5PFS1_WUCBA
MLTIQEIHPLFLLVYLKVFLHQILGLYFGSIRMGMNAFKPRSLADFICCTAFRVSSKVKHLVTVFGTSSCLLWLLKFMNE